MKIKDSITQSVIMRSASDSIFEVVNTMITESVSCILLTDEKEDVVGIITERDLARKFITLDSEHKLEAPAASFMTRPVVFAHMETLSMDIRKMFLEKDIHHFPIIEEGSIHREDIVGILTMTDLAKAFVQQRANKKGSENAKDHPSREVMLLSRNAVKRSNLKTLIEQLPLNVNAKGDMALEEMEEAKTSKMPLILDIDTYAGQKDFQLIVSRSLGHSDHVIFISKNYDLIKTLKGALKAKTHHIMVKPLNLSYLTFLCK